MQNWTIFFAINTVNGYGEGINRSVQFDTTTAIRMKYSKIVLLALFAIIATSVADPEPEPEPEALAKPEPEPEALADAEPNALGK